MDVADLARRFGVAQPADAACERRDLDDDAVDVAGEPGRVALGPEIRYALIDTGAEAAGARDRARRPQC